ncbi:MAG: subclass B1 metallo-beta-lactamase [Flavobacteriales bacterium]|nr:subclass B1 metallo-beta-lactamase [Flavobacteriales bacterium]
MSLKTQLITVFLIASLGCNSQKNIPIYRSESLVLEKLTPSTYRHISYLTTEDHGKVSCNGMIVVDQGEALIFDTPPNNVDSKELIDWVESAMECKVIGVVVTHFHNDCLGGLKEFHDRQIPSYSSSKTLELAKENNVDIPKIGFDDSLELRVGNKQVFNEFPGEGHTRDNTISYFPDEKVLFGGCLIKSVGANKGYTGDANENEWSKTVLAVRSKYNKAKIIIPGHGEPGDSELLDYTIELFKVD